MRRASCPWPEPQSLAAVPSSRLETGRRRLKRRHRARPLRGCNRLEELPRLRRREDRRCALGDDVLRSAHRGAAAGFTTRNWLTTSQSPSMRIAARCCFTVCTDPGCVRTRPAPPRPRRAFRGRRIRDERKGDRPRNGRRRESRNAAAAALHSTAQDHETCRDALFEEFRVTLKPRAATVAPGRRPRRCRRSRAG